MNCTAPSERIHEPALVFRRAAVGFIKAACAHLEEMRDRRIEEHQRRPAIAAERSLALRETDHFRDPFRPFKRAGVKKSPCHRMRAAGFPAILAMAEACPQGRLRKRVSDRTAKASTLNHSAAFPFRPTLPAAAAVLPSWLSLTDRKGHPPFLKIAARLHPPWRRRVCRSRR